MRFIKRVADREQRMMRIEVVLAMPQKQELLEVHLATGATIADAIKRSDIAGMFEGFDLDTAKVGIFGQIATREQTLRDGDRVEIYRPLVADPKEARRQRALGVCQT